MVENGVLDFWGFIEHLPEKDEQKKHKHVYFMPSGQIHTDVIKNQLREPDPLRFDKPLGVTIFKSSKFADWYLYGLHDKDYLGTKGQYREYQYKKEEFIVSDEDFFNEEIHCIDISKLNQMKNLRECIDDGVPFDEMLYNGQIPVQLVGQYRFIYDVLTQRSLNRNGGETHTPKEEKTEQERKDERLRRIMETYDLMEVPNPFGDEE